MRYTPKYVIYMKSKKEVTPERIELAKKYSFQMSKLCGYYIRPIIFGELPFKSLDPFLENATITFIDTA